MLKEGKMNDPHVIRPTARPREAPIAIVGRKIPAGTWNDPFEHPLLFARPDRTYFCRLTIIPNVHAVNPILVIAVRVRRKIFSHIALGLVAGQI